MSRFVELAKLQPGDQVGVISPSAGLPGLFPWVQELGLKRLQENFGLVPVEYPTTRQMGSSLTDRAHDIMKAFSDSKNKAVIASIGGDDQIRLLKYLDPNVLRNNPKPFFGFSDNTHLINYLWRLGIPSYYGGSIMTQYAMQQGMHGLTMEFLRHAFFDNGEFELRPSEIYNDEGLSWEEPDNLAKSRKMEPNQGWFWDGKKDAKGILWGGCFESLVAEFSVGAYLPHADDLEGSILFLESAEDLPDPWVIDYLLTGMGERGWLDRFQAVLVGRPKAWEFDKPKGTAEKDQYSREQRDTVLGVVRSYNQTVPVVQNMDFGHTDPQIVLPVGRMARLDNASRKIFMSY